jgi:hypothetical protein
MTTEEWNRARSSLNHGWLKNQFIVSLYRAKRILAGVVEDDSGMDCVESLLANWPERSVEAENLIDRYSQQFPDQNGAATSEPGRFVHAIAIWRWRILEDPDEKVATAVSALRDLDTRIRNAPDLSIDTINDLLSAAQALADALSEMAVFARPGA